MIFWEEISIIIGQPVLSWIKSLIIGGCCCVLTGCVYQPEEAVESDSNDIMVSKKDLLHTITNQTLKQYIKKFDSTFADHPEVKGKGIALMYTVLSNDTIVYSIGYASVIESEIPVILCEPIHEKPVYLDILPLAKDFSLDQRKAIEVRKEAEMEEYKTFIDDINNRSDSIISSYRIMIPHFAALDLVFDKNRHLVRVDTLEKHLFP